MRRYQNHTPFILRSNAVQIVKGITFLKNRSTFSYGLYRKRLPEALHKEN